MELMIICVSFLVLIAVAYRFYSRWIAKTYHLNDANRTPAEVKNDGVDFVPTKMPYLFAQHFSAIAAAGPIAGPILACQLFGWGPSLLWILFGVVFIGAVHDFSSLIASVRHRACSIAEVASEYIGSKAARALLVFIWICLVYIIVAFADITAGSFVSGTEELSMGSHSFHPGGAVAAASIFYLALSLIMGFVQRFLNPPLWLLTIIFVPCVFAVCWLGTFTSHWFLFDLKTWGLLILAYCALAAWLPVWALLQPRGYLGGYVLYTALALGVIGIFFGGHEIQQDMFKGFEVGGVTGSLFPFLFVTIACGACSGFHGLVCGGTTSKQIAKESHTRAIGYGAMLAEAFVAVIALVTIMILTNEEAKGLKPGVIYGNGIGEFMTILVGREALPFAITFGAMAFSTFVFDTIDVATRLGRFIFQELLSQLFPSKTRASERIEDSRSRKFLVSVVGVLLTLALPAFFLVQGEPGGWVKFWTLFGASNQLLAALTLFCVFAWLVKTKRPNKFVFFPMLFVSIMTIWALASLALTQWEQSQGWDVARVNTLSALALIVLALGILGGGTWSLLRDRLRSKA